MSALRQHVGLLLGRRAGLRVGEAMPAIRVEREVTWGREKVAAYREVTGLVDDGLLPLLAPQVMAVGLHLDVFSDRRFPFKALGLVHVENAVVCDRTVPDDAALTLAASVGNARPGPRGTLLDLVTEARDRDGPLGTWTTTILARGPGGDAAPEKKPDASAEGDLVVSAVVAAPEDIGRRYAAVAGDLNPIHQHAIMARAFGFPRAIAHGMWTLARAMAEAQDELSTHPRRLRVRFRKPLFLPGRFVVEARLGAGGAATLAALPTKGGTPHLVAEMGG